MNKVALIILSLVLAMAVGIGGCVTSPPPETAPAQEAAPVTKKLEILSHSMSGGRGEYVTPVVSGTAQNVSSSTINAYVYVKFYDAERNLLDTSGDSITSLGAGEIWSFKASYIGIDRDKVYSYKIKADLPF